MLHSYHDRLAEPSVRQQPSKLPVIDPLLAIPIWHPAALESRNVSGTGVALSDRGSPGLSSLRQLTRVPVNSCTDSEIAWHIVGCRAVSEPRHDLHVSGASET